MSRNLRFNQWECVFLDGVLFFTTVLGVGTHVMMRVVKLTFLNVKTTVQYIINLSRVALTYQ